MNIQDLSAYKSAPSPVPDIPTRRRKTPQILGIILLVLILSAAGYFIATKNNDTPQASPAPSTTTGQKTYSNSEHSFEFIYADGYVATEQPIIEEPKVLKRLLVLSQADYDAWFIQHAVGDGPANVLSIQVFSAPENLTPLEWAKANVPYSNFVDGTHKEDYVVTSFAGESAISYTRDGLWTSDVNVVKKGDMMIVTSISYAEKSTATYTDLAHILSTFKFTK